MHQTGVPACDALIGFPLRGDLVPAAWYRTVVRKTRRGTRPHLLAIGILADIVYWYRPAEVRDPKTGALLGYRKKFKSDVLQRSYADLVRRFNCSYDTAREAVIFLEELGVVAREFRSLTVGGVRCSNILYLRLDPVRLRELTCPAGENPGEGEGKTSGPSPAEGDPPAGGFTGTDTKTTPETSTEIFPETSSSLEETREEVENELFDGGEIPEAYLADPLRLDLAVQILCEWGTLPPDHYAAPLKREAYALAVAALREMAGRSETRAGGERVTRRALVERINECVRRDVSFLEYLDSVVDDYAAAAERAEVHAPRRYMRAVVWQTFSTFRVRLEAQLARAGFAPL